MASTVSEPVAITLLTSDEAAGFLRVKRSTLEHWRVAGGGPVFVKVGHRVCYRPEALQAWVDQQTRTHTKQVA